MKKLWLCIFLGLSILVLSKFIIQLRNFSSSYIIVEIHTDYEDEFINFTKNEFGAKFKIEAFKYDQFYILKPKFSLFSCPKCSSNQAAEGILKWAEKTNFNHTLFDAGPVLFHDGLPQSLIYKAP